ncbi:hypothetical protein COLINT_02827 [Collinsella intestinalis DSM 13280]|uniref:Uncharacterized protein n=1 Tax=Collinsella intestinalis DSM 13280 TaxID=521003 RepID=C4F9U3_9ACTN|nr:hypothetical protein COLINT_02827 [Collinsella intestinalis DSM 13280]
MLECAREGERPCDGFKRLGIRPKTVWHPRSRWTAGAALM